MVVHKQVAESARLDAESAKPVVVSITELVVEMTVSAYGTLSSRSFRKEGSYFA